MRVLVVDDDDDIRLLLRLWLDAEHDVEIVGEATDGDAALHVAGELAPDAVVLDLQMPGADGLRAVPRLREHCPDVAVLVYSATSRREDALAAGAHAYVEKSTSLEGVVRALRELVAAR